MSLDDILENDDSFAQPIVCDECCDNIEAEGPTPMGWQMLVFKCFTCERQFCPHLEAQEHLCIACSGHKPARRPPADCWWCPPMEVDEDEFSRVWVKTEMLERWAHEAWAERGFSVLWDFDRGCWVASGMSEPNG